MAETGRLAEYFTRERASFTTSPLYRSLCDAVAEDEPVLDLLTHRRPGQQAAFLLFGAVHYLLLRGAQHPLRGYYPSLAGAAAAGPAGAGPVFGDFCRAHAEALAELIRTRLVQTNVVRRVTGLRLVLAAVYRRCGRPVHLIDVGASAGVHLHVDRYRYVIGGQVFGRPDAAVTIETWWRGPGPVPDLDAVPPIASRTGIDLNPVRVADPDERLWLRALVWPENTRDAELLASALDSLAADPPPILAGDVVDLCRQLDRVLPAGEPRVVFHSATRMHVPLARRAAFDQAIDSLGSRGPLYHAWQEPAAAQHHGMPGEAEGMLAMHGPGDTRPVPLARVSGHLEWAGQVSPRRER